MTDNQDSKIGDAVQPPTDRPLTAGDWIEWHGGENPVPGQKICWRNAHGAEHGPVLSNEVCGFGFPSMPGSATIIAYRLARPATSAASEDGWSPVNVNDTVQVRLTNLGRETHKAYWEPFSAGNYRPVKVDGDGWAEFQLWDLMAVFGPKIRMGMEVPFETTIRVKTPALASPPPAREEAPAEGAGESPLKRVMDRASLTDALTPGHPDAFLNAILDYTSGFYGAAREAGMPASSVADAMNHVERAARGLHALALRNRTSEPEAGEASQNDYSPRKTLTDPAPATADKLRELIEAAYIAGATNVHEYWCDNPGEAPAPRDDPEFDEAASDYAFAALNEQPQ